MAKRQFSFRLDDHVNQKLDELVDYYNIQESQSYPYKKLSRASLLEALILDKHKKQINNHKK